MYVTHQEQAARWAMVSPLGPTPIKLTAATTLRRIRNRGNHSVSTAGHLNIMGTSPTQIPGTIQCVWGTGLFGRVQAAPCYTSFVLGSGILAADTASLVPNILVLV